MSVPLMNMDGLNKMLAEAPPLADYHPTHSAPSMMLNSLSMVPSAASLPDPFHGLYLLNDDGADAEGAIHSDQTSPPSARPSSVQLPLSLPAPVIKSPTNPYVDLSLHLQRHGLPIEALEFARAQVTCDFVLHAFLTMYKKTAPMHPTSVADATQVSQDGEALLCELERTLRTSEASVQEQVQHASLLAPVPPGHMLLPLTVCLPWSHGVPATSSVALPVLPTHLLALCRVHRRVDIGGAGGHLVDHPCTLVPVHWIVYVLQCAHMPSVPGVPDPSGAAVPVLPLAMPFPQYWSLIHRWLYTRDSHKLLAGLLPLDALDRLSASAPLAGSASMIHALSQLSMPALLRVAKMIRATWHNGRCLGVFSDVFWTTIERAWQVLVCGIVLRKARMAPSAPPPAFP